MNFTLKFLKTDMTKNFTCNKNLVICRVKPLLINKLRQIGKSLGFDFNFSKSERIPNTFNAHRLLWKAKEMGLQTELSEALFKCYFTDGKDIGSKEILLEVAVEGRHGFRYN